MRTLFEEQLNQLHKELAKMGHCVERTIEKTIDALKHQDNTLAIEIVNNDEIINEMQRSIESKALNLMLCQQPVASDLRKVTAALKVVTDLERIGDQAADIASIILKIHDDHAYQMIEAIPLMAKLTKKMVCKAVEAFIQNDLEYASDVVASDDEVDDLFKVIKEKVIVMIKEDSKNIDSCLDFLMIAKYFERISDHATNICEWLEFSQRGSVNNHRLI